MTTDLCQFMAKIHPPLGFLLKYDYTTFQEDPKCRLCDIASQKYADADSSISPDFITSLSQ